MGWRGTNFPLIFFCLFLPLLDQLLFLVNHQTLFPPQKYMLNPSECGGGRNHHPLSENHDFSGTKPLLDLRPVCKFKFVRCGPLEKNQSALSFSVEAWRLNEVREHLFPNSEIEIFIDFCQFSTNFSDFRKILRGPV